MNNYQKLLPYAMVIGTTAIALFLTFLLEPFLTQFISVFFFVSITITTWYGGLRPGFVAIVLSTLAVNKFFVPPEGQISSLTAGDVVRFVSFSLVGVVIHTLGSSLREGQRRIQQLNQQLLDESADRLRVALNEAQASQTLLQRQFEQQRLMMEIAQRIRQSLTLEDILQTTVHEVCQLLQTDRVVIFRFFPDWRGIVEVESCGDNWTKILSTEINDPCFGENYIEPFKQGLVTAKADIYTAGIGECHLELLSHFQVRANLVVPIMKGDELWGLLIAHHCEAPRQWKDSEINLLRQIASQVGMALQQSALFEQIQAELVERKQAEASLQQSEARLRLAQIASNSGVWDWDVQKNTLFWSPEYYQLYALNPALEANYENWLRCIHPDDREKIDRQTLQVLEGGSAEFRVEFRVLRSDGIRWFAGIGQVLRDEADQPFRMIGIAIDITQQKQIEIALQDFNTELEQRVTERTEELNALNNRLLMALKEQHWAKQEVEDLYNNAPCGYHSLNVEGTIVRINDTALSWLGYTRDEVLNQMKFTDLITPESQPIFHQNFPQFIQRGWVNDLEFQLRHKDGSTRWVSVTSTATTDEAGNFVMSRSSMFDISDRKQAEQTLALQAVITRSIAEGICLVKEDATIVYANPKFEQMFGYDSGELDGQNVSILNYETQTATAEATAQSIINTVLQSREFTYEVHNVKKDGTPFWCRATCSVFNHPDYGNVLVAVQQDVTHSKQAEAVLREAERRWRSLLENVQLIVVGLDINGKVEYINPFFLKLTGYALEEVLGEFWFDSFVHSSQKLALEHIFQVILKHNLYPHHQNPIVTKSGEERMIAWSNTVLQDITGKAIGTISIGEDITERYKIERMKAEFISVVSHELRTPLTSMQAALNLLNEKIIDPRSEEGEVTIQIATEGTDRLVRLVNDILDLERLESGKVRLEKHLYNIDDLVTTAVAQMQEMANQAEITLQANACHAQVAVDGDRLIQVLTNLLSNAVKFSPQHSVIQLSIEQQESENHQSVLLFAVRDQGRGIPADKLESIFDRFHQVDASDSREKGGTGLGLAICRSIVRQHGGEIWVESTVGQGSTFYFTIPMKNEGN